MAYEHKSCAAAFVVWKPEDGEPGAFGTIHPLEQKLVDALYHAQYVSFCTFWGRVPDAATCALYNTRARHDAHATYKAAQNNAAIFGG